MNFFWRAAVCINIYERIYFPSFHQVHDDEILCPFCSKKCKSVGGLKRHVTQCKHKDERENGPETDENRKQIYKRITRKDSRGSQTPFDQQHGKRREELSAYQFTRCSIPLYH